MEQGDVELLQLARLYQPVLWAPEKAVLAEQAWRLYLAEQPGAERTEAAAKEAASTKNTPALRVRIPPPSLATCLLWQRVSVRKRSVRAARSSEAGVCVRGCIAAPEGSSVLCSV